MKIIFDTFDFMGLWQGDRDRRMMLLRHVMMWLIIWIVYNIDLITAWAGDGPMLSLLTVAGCMVSVYLSLPYSKRLIFDRISTDHEFKLTNKILIQLCKRVVLYAFLGSILSFVISLVLNSAWLYYDNTQNFWDSLEKCSSLFKTTYHSLITVDSANSANFVVQFFRFICEKDNHIVAFIFSFIRNWPEAFMSTAAFILWEAMIIIERQNRQIEKSRLVKETLANSDMIHGLMNVYFASTDALKDFSQFLSAENQGELQKLITLQETIGKLQRFRFSLIKDNEHLVYLEYEIKAIRWMMKIVTYGSINVIFKEDIEDVEPRQTMIVPGILTELVWNAIKHSKVDDPKQKIDITVELAIKDNEIKFYIENPIGNKSEKSTNSGLNILERRLDIEYGKGNYSFNLSKEQKEKVQFVAALSLPIK
jgi:two-component sensor histidine kinase